MKLHYQGQYNLDPDTLPHGEHQPEAVAFKEANDTKTIGLIANVLCVVIIVVLGTAAIFRVRPSVTNAASASTQVWLGCIASMLTLFPHELLHAICFRKDVYLYTNLKQGMLFVVGPETMSKGRFIFMSLLPN